MHGLTDPGCGPVAHGCVFAGVLLAHVAGCGCASRRSVGEQLAVDCGCAAARQACATLAALLRERSRFALKLPAAGPLTHQQALRLHCGGVLALHRHMALDAAEPAPPLPELQRLVAAAQERHGRLADLPWAALMPDIAAWQPRRRRAALE